MISIKIIELDNVQQYRLTKEELIIGRSSKSHIQVKDQSCSGFHCALYLDENNRAVIRDLDSTNGTIVNGNKTQGTYIYINDTIQIGRIRIELINESMSSNERHEHTRLYTPPKCDVLDFEKGQKRRVTPQKNQDNSQRRIPELQLDLETDNLKDLEIQKQEDPHKKKIHRKMKHEDETFESPSLFSKFKKILDFFLPPKKKRKKKKKRKISNKN